MQVQVTNFSIVFAIFHISSVDHWYYDQLVEHPAMCVSLAPPVRYVNIDTLGLEPHAPVS